MSHEGGRQPPLNPFSPTAVAKVSESTDMISVETPSTIEALRYVDAYLQSPSEHGYVLAVQGDYGSGKTHLAAMLLNRVSEWRQEDPVRRSARPVYLDAADQFDELYIRFVKGLPENEVYFKTREYYADTIAEQLGDNEVSAQVRSQLRAPGADLEQASSDLGLSEYRLVCALRDKLDDVTNDESFATVLSLLVRPGFRRPAWQWLTGGPPDPLLVERGVERSIDTTASAIEAFGVFAKLYGHRGDRLVLVIDELGKLIPSHRLGSSAAELSAFQHLLESFESAKAMLVLVGLKESLDLIGGGPRQRVSAFITMSRFDVPATSRFIELSLDRVRDWEGDRLHPFTAEAVKDIVNLTSGNPRRIGLYCRRLFHDSIREDARPEAITAADVRQAAREHFSTDKQQQVTVEVQATLEAHHWDYYRDYFVSADPGSKVDYWIPAGDSGCALFLADSVTEPADVERFTSRARFVRQRSPCEMLLVVSEALAPEYRGPLTEAFGREVLVYQPNSFTEDLASLVKSLLHRLSQVNGGDALAELRNKVDLLASQQSRVHDNVEHLMAGLQELRTSADQGVGDLRREFDSMSRSVAAVARLVSRESDTGLPDVVAAVFADSLDDLSAVDTTSELVDRLFAQQSAAEPAARGALAAIRAATRLDRNRSAMTALGVSATLRTLTASFRRSISEWFRTSAPSLDRRLPTAALDRLDTLCEAYDAVYEYLPMFELDQLHPDAGPDGWTSRAEQLRALRAKFETLAVDVRRAVIGLFPR
jgi:Cdc6-like AAA superfamily ATPase